MKSYVINLERSVDRRDYMKGILKEHSELDAEFVSAVDGRTLDKEECEARFDSKHYARLFLKYVRPGEIGCTLSHQKCYKKLLASKEPCAFILEDDIIVKGDLSKAVAFAERFLDTDEPRVLLFSGWFWYTSAHRIDDSLKSCHVRDAYLTHAYALNRAAALLMIDDKPYYVADYWLGFRARGVKIYAFLPHIIDQEWDGSIVTMVDDQKIMEAPFLLLSWFKIKTRMAFQHLYKYLGRFEYPRYAEKRLRYS